jgi:hypothetical protein
MGNTAYLCCSNFERTYPSFDNPKFRPEVHTLAGARQCVPLLWLALFRPDDLRTDVLLSEDGDDLGDAAPFARTSEALARLDAGVARLEKALPGIGPLAGHAELFREVFRKTRGKYVTIELEEIAWLARSRRGFDSQLRRSLAYLAGAQVRGARAALRALSGVDPKRRLVPPHELFARRRATKADLVACMTAVGTSFIREVPWEVVPEHLVEPPRPPRAPKLHESLYAALEAGDERAARGLLARGADPNASGRIALFTMHYVMWTKVGLGFADELVRAGFDLSKRRGGYTAIQWAIWGDAVDLVARLLELGASASQKDSFGRTALALCAHAGALSCLELFMKDADERAIRAAIRAGDKRLAKPVQAGTGTVAERARIRRALARLRAGAAAMS